MRIFFSSGEVNALAGGSIIFSQLYGFSDILSSDFGYIKQLYGLRLTGNHAETEKCRNQPFKFGTSQSGPLSDLCSK